MEQRVSLREVNQHLARYVKAVEAGERIVITRRGRPIALLSPISRQEKTLSAAQEEALERLLNQSYHLGGEPPLGMSCMSVERFSLDANILFYTVDADAGKRQEKAREIVRQAAQETAKKAGPTGRETPAQASEAVRPMPWGLFNARPSRRP